MPKKMKMLPQCVYCRTTDTATKFLNIFDQIGIKNGLADLMSKFYKRNLSHKKDQKQLICMHCADYLIELCDQDDSYKEKGIIATIPSCLHCGIIYPISKYITFKKTDAKTRLSDLMFKFFERVLKTNDAETQLMCAACYDYLDEFCTLDKLTDENDTGTTPSCLHCGIVYPISKYIEFKGTDSKVRLADLMFTCFERVLNTNSSQCQLMCVTCYDYLGGLYKLDLLPEYNDTKSAMPKCQLCGIMHSKGTYHEIFAKDGIAKGLAILVSHKVQPMIGESQLICDNCVNNAMDLQLICESCRNKATDSKLLRNQTPECSNCGTVDAKCQLVKTLKMVRPEIGLVSEFQVLCLSCYEQLNRQAGQDTMDT